MQQRENNQKYSKRKKCRTRKTNLYNVAIGRKFSKNVGKGNKFSKNVAKGQKFYKNVRKGKKSPGS